MVYDYWLLLRDLQMVVMSCPDVEANNKIGQTLASRGRRAPALGSDDILSSFEFIIRTSHVLVKETSF